MPLSSTLSSQTWSVGTASGPPAKALVIVWAWILINGCEPGGWNFKALILLNHDKVLYKLWSGQPNLDRTEQKKKPLGPLQEIDATARALVMH